MYALSRDWHTSKRWRFIFRQTAYKSSVVDQHPVRRLVEQTQQHASDLCFLGFNNLKRGEAAPDRNETSPFHSVFFGLDLIGEMALKIERAPWKLNTAAHFQTLTKDDPISSLLLSPPSITNRKRNISLNWNTGGSRISVALHSFSHIWFAGMF